MLNLAAAMKAVRTDVADLVPEDLRPYLKGRVLVSSWYPEVDHIRLMRILADWIRQPGKDVWHYIGRKNAEIDLGGIYSAMVASGRPDATLQRGPRLWRLYRDSGVEVVRDLDAVAGSGVIELRDYAFAGPEVASLVSGYFEQALLIAGAASATVATVSDGADSSDGVMLWQASWQV